MNTLYILTFNLLSTTLKVVVVRRRFGQGEKAESDTEHLVDVIEESVFRPGDHDDGSLERDL